MPREESPVNSAKLYAITIEVQTFLSSTFKLQHLEIKLRKNYYRSVLVCQNFVKEYLFSCILHTLGFEYHHLNIDKKYSLTTIGNKRRMYSAS